MAPRAATLGARFPVTWNKVLQGGGAGATKFRAPKEFILCVWLSSCGGRERSQCESAHLGLYTEVCGAALTVVLNDPPAEQV